jgi:hypothetical protein
MDLKMRVFVVNSEDAKAVAEYIKGHVDQVPAPFVVLAKHLSMAVLYDPLTLDLSDASVADRLRKQVPSARRVLACCRRHLLACCERLPHFPQITLPKRPLAPSSCARARSFRDETWRVGMCAWAGQDASCQGVARGYRAQGRQSAAPHAAGALRSHAARPALGRLFAGTNPARRRRPQK